VAGMPIGQVYRDNRAFNIAIRYPEEHRGSADSLGALLIDVPGGFKVALRELADVRMVEGPVQISRENGERRVGIELNVSGRDIGGFVEEAQRRLRERVRLPPGYYVSWGGQFESQQQAMRRLAVILPAVVVVIFVLLLMTFQSAWLASLVLINLPFATVGGVFALFVWGLYLSVPASVGFIVLFGVAVLNGLVLVSCISQLRAEGESVARAVMHGCEIRLRPGLMTASIAIFSLVPMVFATGPGSEVQRPLAVVVVGGLVSSTALTLFGLPILYSWVEEWRERARGGRSAATAAPRAVRPR
jgi:heavy metal efflux system protein